MPDKEPLARLTLTVEITPTVLRFDFRGSPLVWRASPAPSRDYDVKTIGHASLDTSESYNDDDPWFAFWCADCFDPPIEVIRAPSWDAAYERFCEIQADAGHYLIKDGDPDYSDDAGHYTDDGRRVDSECFQGCEITLTHVDVTTG